MPWTPTALVGREAELRHVTGLLEGLPDRGASLLVRGDAGVGKSALLARVVDGVAAAQLTVLTTTGVPSETQLAFAGLHQLLAPLLPRLGHLPDPQAQALSTAVGLRGGSRPDLFLIALATLNLLADAAADAPLLVVSEDAHWLDADTCEVLGFVARRVELEPIVMVFAVRDGHRTPLDDARLPELHLGALADDDAAALLDMHAPGLAREPRRRLLAAAEGNPLALIELPRAAADHGLRTPSQSVLPPLNDTLERAFSERASALPRTTRTVLLVAALNEGGALGESLAAASALDGRPVAAGALREAERAGLVTVEGSAVRFRHPLVRAAIEQGAADSDRRAAHSALADAHADDPERCVWHRAAACTGPDARVAGDLEDAAARAMRRGAPAVAAARLERAAELTAEPGDRARLLLQAADMEFDLGRSDLALRLLAQVRPLPLGPGEAAQLALLLEGADEDSWSGPERVASVAQIAAEMAASREPERALKALLVVARSCWWGNPTQATRDLVVATTLSLDVAPDHPARLAVLACADPFTQGAHVLDRIRRLSPDPTADPAAQALVGTAATAVWGFDLAAPFLATAAAGLRAQGRLGLLAQTLVSQAWTALHLAKTALAQTAAEEAGRLARETGQPRWAVAADVVRATVAGERGDTGTAERLASEAEAELLPVGAQAMLALVQFARGRSAIAHQRYAEGLDQARRTLDPNDVAHHPFVGSWALADLIEAAAYLDRRDDARSYLDRLEHLTAATGGPMLLAQAAYARPLVAADDDAEPLYQEALETGLRHWPCYRARMLLAYGRWLRRRRRVAESRAPLRAAGESAEALGLEGLADLARQELRASGEVGERRTPQTRDQLTTQELQIAQLAAEGLSNRDIGERLYLSHRTVGSHLYRAFPKLGITSRAQLAEALAATNAVT